MKKQRGTVGGLAALLTACGTAATAVQEPADSPAAEQTFVCPEPDGATYFGTASLDEMAYQIIAHDHDCDGRATRGELYPIISLLMADGQQYPAMILVPVGFWLDANEDGIAQYDEFIMKDNGPYAQGDRS